MLHSKRLQRLTNLILWHAQRYPLDMSICAPSASLIYELEMIGLTQSQTLHSGMEDHQGYLKKVVSHEPFWIEQSSQIMLNPSDSGRQVW